MLLTLVQCDPELWNRDEKEDEHPLETQRIRDVIQGYRFEMWRKGLIGGRQSVWLDAGGLWDRRWTRRQSRRFIRQ